MAQKRNYNIIFDLGGVLIDWNPRYVYRKMCTDEEKIEYFLTNICNNEWNIQQDGGRSFAVATAERIELFPQWKEWIEAFYGRWTEMVSGPVEPTVDIVRDLKREGRRLFALTNWSAEVFPMVREWYPWLRLFEDIVVSGEEKCVKPDEKIYRILLERNGLRAEECIFIDDNPVNCDGARALGINAIQFKSPEELRDTLSILLK